MRKLHLLIEKYSYGMARHIVMTPDTGVAPSHEQVVEFLKRVQVPPEFSLAPFDAGFVLSFHIPNSICPHQMEETNLFVHLPEDRDTWVGILQASLYEAVMHEVDEYYKVDGAVVREPHPELTPEERGKINQAFMINCEHYGQLGICRPNERTALGV